MKFLFFWAYSMGLDQVKGWLQKKIPGLFPKAKEVTNTTATFVADTNGGPVNPAPSVGSGQEMLANDASAEEILTYIAKYGALVKGVENKGVYNENCHIKKLREYLESCDASFFNTTIQTPTVKGNTYRDLLSEDFLLSGKITISIGDDGLDIAIGPDMRDTSVNYFHRNLQKCYEETGGSKQVIGGCWYNSTSDSFDFGGKSEEYGEIPKALIPQVQHALQDFLNSCGENKNVTNNKFTY